MSHTGPSYRNCNHFTERPVYSKMFTKKSNDEIFAHMYASWTLVCTKTFSENVCFFLETMKS